jgi:hypothetical protein
MMNLLFGCAYFAISLLVALFGNVGLCFALCYIPALMFFRPVTGYQINAGIPELSAANVAALAMVIGTLCRVHRKFPFRWTLLDTLVAIAPVFTIISAMLTENLGSVYENFHTGYNEFSKQLLGWLAPYFVARACFSSEQFRRVCLWSLIVCIFILTPFSLIEMRFWPQFYVQCLQRIGLEVSNDPLVMFRLGYYRTQVSFTHPIFFGDASLSMAVLVLLLGHTTSVGTRNIWVRLAAGFSVFELVASLSFGPYAGLLIGTFVFLVLRYAPLGRHFLVPAAVIVMLVVAAITYQIAQAPLPPRDQSASLQDSMWVRRMIIKNSWPMVREAGFFGWGRLINRSDIAWLESVDNAYLMFAMCRGWLYAVIWMMIPLLVGWRAVRAMGAFTQSRVHWFPLAVGAGGVMGVSAAFYGVWAGWAGEPYTMLWLIAVAFTNSLCDLCFQAARQPLPNQRRASAIMNPPARPGILAPA